MMAQDKATQRKHKLESDATPPNEVEYSPQSAVGSYGAALLWKFDAAHEGAGVIDCRDKSRVVSLTSSLK
jgi:hypothetical protein